MFHCFSDVSHVLIYEELDVDEDQMGYVRRKENKFNPPAVNLIKKLNDNLHIG